MDAELKENIVNIYENAAAAAVLFDSCGEILWRNAVARSEEYNFTNLQSFPKRIFIPFVIDGLKKNGNIYYKPNTDFGIFGGVMLTVISDCVLAVFDHSNNNVSDLGRFKVGGIQMFSNYLRSNVDKISLSAAAIESAMDSDDPEVEGLFDNIRLGNYKTLRSVQNLSLLAAYSASSVILKKQNCDIREMISALITSVQSVCRERIPIKLNLPEKSLITKIDVRFFEKAFLNVISNAMTFTRDGNEIEIGVKVNRSNVIVMVKDKGAGIKERNLSYITTPYFSIEPADDGGCQPGLGLGLPVAAAFCESHGGTLVINSRFGEGTTVAMSFANNEDESQIFNANVATYVTDKFSPVYIELCEHCFIPR